MPIKPEEKNNLFIVKTTSSETKEATMNKQAQAVMEFLITYSWAIIVVLISTLALATLGILNSHHFIGSACILPPGIACVDFSVETARIILVLQNGFGEIITINQIDVQKNNGNICSATTPIQLQDQQRAIIIVSGCTNGNVGEKFIGEINLTYQKTTISHRLIGSIVNTINPSSTISSSGTCQNGQAGGLCSGLDLVYGFGYQAACCSEWGLCCG